jgi:hypothetical protein
MQITFSTSNQTMAAARSSSAPLIIGPLSDETRLAPRFTSAKGEFRSFYSNSFEMLKGAEELETAGSRRFCVEKKSPAATGEKGNYCGQKLFCINFPPGCKPQAGAKSRVSPFC